MDRLLKCKILKERGYFYDPNTGKIYGRYGKEITGTTPEGYILIQGEKHFPGNVLGHHFAWFMFYENVNFRYIKHINRRVGDNRILNLKKY
jgi:hypothetical protein